jgi:hypothetical protein
MPRKRSPKPHANDNMSDETQDSGCDHHPMDDISAELPIADLDFASQLFVWGIRSWVQALKTKRHFSQVTGNAFSRFNLVQSATALDDLMTVVAAAAARMIDVRCIRCPALSPDEAILIDALISSQRQEYFKATVVLRKMLPGAAARIALPHLAELARDLIRSGMILRAATHASSDLPASARIGAASLH